MTSASTTHPVHVAISGRPGDMGKQQQALTPLIDAASAPQARIGLAEVHMSGDHQSLPHVHEQTPMIVCVLDGQAATHYGPKMVPLRHGPGHMVYVPEGVEHAASNRSPLRLIGVEARLLPPGGRFDDDTTPARHLQPMLDKSIRMRGLAPVEDYAGAQLRPTLVEAHGDRPGFGLVRIVHRESVPNATLSSARLNLPPAPAASMAEHGRSVEPAQVHRHTQRIFVLLSGTVALICGTGDKPHTIRMRHNSVVWLPEDTPYVLVNIGHQHAIGLAYSTDPTFDSDRELTPDLDQSAAAIIDYLRQH